MRSPARSRLFFALWPDDETRAALARVRDAWTWNGEAAPEQTDRLHLTLHFIGAVPQQRLPALLEGLAASSDPFELCLDRHECWPNGVAALTPTALPPELLAMYGAMRAELVRMDLPVEARAYRPHVTLARHARTSVIPAEALAVRWRVNGYVLVESQSAPNRYVVLRAYP